MIQNGKSVFFFISVFLLLESGSLGMNKEEDFFSKLLRKITTSSKKNKGNISCNQLNQKTSNSEEDFKMVNMKEVALKKKEDPEDWVLLDDNEDKELMNGWENVEDENSEEFSTYDPIYLNDEKLIKRINDEKTKQIVELFENF